jgi:hypothetical protein
MPRLPSAMRLSPEELAAAEKLHASVRGFEKTKNVQLWSSAFYGVAVGISVGSLHGSDHHGVWIYYLGAFGGLVLSLIFMRRFAKARYDRDKLLLQVLERDHADELPWTEEDRQEARVKDHLAAVQQIQQELAHSRA